MVLDIQSNFELNTKLEKQQSQPDPLISSQVDSLLDAKIVLAGMNVSDVTFMKTMLEITGFSNITITYDEASVMLALRKGIQKDVCDIDLLVLSSDFTELSTQALRMTMDQFDEWRLIPIISLTQESQWDHAQVLTDLGHGVTSLLYHPLTAESIPPAVMTALAVKKERDQTYQRQTQLEEELASLKVMEARLKFSVNHDDLTGLANRHRLEKALQISLTQVRNFTTTSSLYYIDLDSFKVLNDASGHEAGDALLIQVANTLRGYFSASDTLVRIGSDEYSVLVDDTSCDETTLKAEGLRTLFDGYSFEYLGHYFHLSASIGVRFIQAKDQSTTGEILAQANQACYTAKKRGGNRVHVYSGQDNEMQSLHQNVQWAPRIRAALKQEDFFLEFQPIQSLKFAETKHFECLIRMKGEAGEIYYPNDFIPIAEQIGLIHQIDMWVINSAFEIISTIESDISIAVNLSGNILSDNDLTKLVECKLNETGINPSRMVFEITETSAISNFEMTKSVVNQIRALGCRFALDDFGAGFNSYSYLKHFPVDILKIDGSFITNLVVDPVDQLLVKSMIDIAHSLDKKVVAEFVEHKETVKLLENYNVDFIQGYLVGKPQKVLPLM